MPRVILALAALAASGLLANESVAAASAEHGKAAFMRAGCWQCHGTAGQGSIAGPKLAPDPLPFESLSAFVRSSSRAMPPFREEVLSDEDLADIYAYLQSIPAAPSPDSIPLLKE
jgi:ubiquinol-cytochrome c reductase cytochrome c subunit